MPPAHALPAGTEGSIPPDLASLGQLLELNLDYTSVGGQLPELCRQGAGSPLRDVYLRGTQLSGPVDRSFAFCSELVSLNLQVRGRPVTWGPAAACTLHICWYHSTWAPGPVLSLQTGHAIELNPCLKRYGL